MGLNASCLPVPLQPGWYVTVHISNVPRRLAGGRGGSTQPYGLTSSSSSPPSPSPSPSPPPSLSLSLQTEHRDLSSIPLVVFGLLQHEHKARKLKTCWKLAAGRTFCKTVCDCCSFLTDVSATLCAQEDHHLLSPYSVKGMCLL